MKLRLLQLLGVIGSCFAAGWLGVACASDEGIPDPSNPIDASGGSAGGDSMSWGGAGGGDGMWPGGTFGAPCTLDDDCQSGQCSEIGQKASRRVCTEPCSGVCPAGGYCITHEANGDICIPDLGNQCAICVTSGECPTLGDLCLTAPKKDHFCARDCSVDGKCPSGFSCATPESYDPSVSGSGGGDGGTGGKKVCVPDSADGCPCDSKRAGATRTCSAQSGSLVCGGTETCNGQSGAWENCSAGAPTSEICDGADNDCNGTADDGSPAAMCASQGSPAHADWACTNGACVVGACDPGYTNYPASLPPSAGCPCQMEANEPNDSCATAAVVGSVTDANTTAVTISGRLSSDSDEDWYKFDTVDSDEGTTNTYHVKIVFTAPQPTNDEFVFDVIRSDTCATPDAKHSNLLAYDWCVDGTGMDMGGTTIGEQSCGPTAARHCGPHTKSYLVRVHRKAGVTGSCSEYSLTITAKGGGSCDFSQATGACDNQVQEP